MRAPSRPVSRGFPDYGWAWPRGSLDQLLRAALLPDESAALTVAGDWLERHDIDSAGFREHRLLATISHRFGKALAGHPAYPRLLGLRRQLWTKSRMAAREAEPALRAIAAAGIPILLIKGAARIARDADTETGRVAHDIDIVVHPDDLGRAFAELLRLGWRASSGASEQYLATQLQSIQSLNCFAGPYGDIDLHRDAFPSLREDRDEERVWAKADRASFHGIPVLVPSRPDQAALAIAHGCLAAHVHSDWIVDCVDAISAEAFSWDAFAAIIATRRMSVPATIVLSYLAQELTIDVPAGLLARETAEADRSGYAERIGVLLQAKPRTDMSRLLNAARWVAKKRRMRRERLSRAIAMPQPSFRGREFRRARPAPEGGFATSHELSLAGGAGRTANARLAVEVEVEAPRRARRIELEINGLTRHVARLRFRCLRGRDTALLLRFEGRAGLDRGDLPLRIESRPLRQIRDWESAEDAAPYRALRFRLLGFSVEDSP
jgi:hypothetical protein